MFAEIASAIAPTLIDKFTSKKVNGIPTPQGYGGSAGGSEYRDFLNSAFPGTTPWEQLGANTPVGPVEASKKAADTQERMQSKELINRRDIASMTARAQVISALGPTSPMAAKSALDMLNGGSGSHYDTHTQQDAQKVAAELDNLDADTRNKVWQAALAKAGVGGVQARSDRANESISAEIGGRYAPLINSIASIVGLGLGGAAFGAASKGGSALVNLGRNTRAGKYVSDGFNTLMGIAKKHKLPFDNY